VNCFKFNLHNISNISIAFFDQACHQALLASMHAQPVLHQHEVGWVWEQDYRYPRSWCGRWHKKSNLGL